MTFIEWISKAISCQNFTQRPRKVSNCIKCSRKLFTLVKNPEERMEKLRENDLDDTVIFSTASNDIKEMRINARINSPVSKPELSPNSTKCETFCP